MGLEPILTIYVNLTSDIDGDGDGVCKRALKNIYLP